jgi:hypothetical protein
MGRKPCAIGIGGFPCLVLIGGATTGRRYPFVKRSRPAEPCADAGDMSHGHRVEYNGDARKSAIVRVRGVQE